MELEDVVHVLVMPMVLTRFNAHKVANSVPLDTTMVVMDFSKTAVIFRNGAEALLTALLADRWATVRFKGWPYNEDVLPFLAAAEKHDMTHLVKY